MTFIWRPAPVSALPRQHPHGEPLKSSLTFNNLSTTSNSISSQHSQNNIQMSFQRAGGGQCCCTHLIEMLRVDLPEATGGRLAEWAGPAQAGA